jgi:hypothetical protein
MGANFADAFRCERQTSEAKSQQGFNSTCAVWLLSRAVAEGLINKKGSHQLAAPSPRN